MPIYAYKCKTCGNQFEVQQKMSDSALTSCPNEICDNENKGKGEVQRIISANVGLMFKGSGFYLTDYNKKSEPNSSKTDAA